MKKRQRKKLIRTVIEFIKLQIAGNVLFVSTMVGTFALSTIAHWDTFNAFLCAGIASNVLYFALDRQWVFTEKSSRRRKGHRDVVRFVIFAVINFVLNIIIVKILSVYGINVYLSQVLSGFFFAVWCYVGLKFWVFAPSRHHAITYESPRRGRKYDHGPQRKAK